MRASDVYKGQAVRDADGILHIVASPGAMPCVRDTGHGAYFVRVGPALPPHERPLLYVREIEAA